MASNMRDKRVAKERQKVRDPTTTMLADQTH